MAESLIAGAAVGAVFGELLKAVLDVKDRAVMFKQTLMYLQSTLIAIAPVIKEMEQHNKDLGHPKEELESLIRQMDEGTKLVVKCSKIHRLNLVAKVRYQEQLVGLVDSLTRFFIIDMQAQTARDQKETLIKVRKLLSTVNKLPFINTQDTSGACSDSNPVSGEVTVMESEIYDSKKAQRADENAHYIVEDMEEVEIYFSCASSPCAIGVNESDTPRSTQPSENACRTNSPQHGNERSSVDVDFFSEYGEGSRYRIGEVIGKGSQGIVCSAYDTHSGEKVAIKKISDIFEQGSDGTCILREIKLLRLLRHPDIVEIKHILLPPSRREFKDVYVVFELMESDLDMVIKANDDLTPEHHEFFLYQLLRGLKYLHTANVFHRDLKPKNILANANCKLKICDFGLARVAFNDTPTAKFWTDYVAARWYRAPELCGSFFSKYTPAIDMWSIGCIFAELVTGKPLFPGKNVVHQLDLMTNFLGTPSPEAIARVRNEKARRYLSSMRKKKPVPFSQKFLNVDPLALRLLERMLAFEPKDRPTAEEALADPYFKSLAKIEREPSSLPISKMEFEFERRSITKEDVQELIYREILEYHPKLLKEYLEGAKPT